MVSGTYTARFNRWQLVFGYFFSGRYQSLVVASRFKCEGEPRRGVITDCAFPGRCRPYGAKAFNLVGCSTIMPHRWCWIAVPRGLGICGRFARSWAAGVRSEAHVRLDVAVTYTEYGRNEIRKALGKNLYPLRWCRMAWMNVSSRCRRRIRPRRGALS